MRGAVLTSLLMIVALAARAQDGQFSQYFASPLLINPATVGVLPELELSANYKSGGELTDGRFRELIHTSVSYPLKKKIGTKDQFGGVGASFLRERAGAGGIVVYDKFLLTGAYSLKLSKFTNRFLSFGLQGGLVQNTIDESRLDWGAQYNPFASASDPFTGVNPDNLSSPQSLYPVFNFGVIYAAYDNNSFFVRDRSLTIGLSIDNLNRPSGGFLETQFNDFRQDAIAKLFGFGKIELAPRYFLYPSFLGYTSNNQSQWNIGTYLSMAVQSVSSKRAALVHIGTWYRVEDSFIFLAGFQIDQIRLSGSFDLNNTSITSIENLGDRPNTFEISLTYRLIKQLDSRKISNPIF